MEQVSISQILRTGQEDLSWYQKNFKKLLNDYNNKYIAFFDKQVIDSDKDIKKLLTKLRNKDVNTSNIIIRFVSKIKKIL